MPADFVIPDPAALEAVCDAAPSKVAILGKRLAGEGKVVSYAEVKPGQSYQAMVKGQRMFRVDLVYDRGKWGGTCSCPAIVGCEHLHAAMLTLLREASEPEGSLKEQLAAALKRRLKPAEIEFVKKVNELYRRWQQSDFIADWDVNGLLPGWGTRTYNKLVPWPAAPADATEFWHYLSLEAKQRNVPVPEFMRRLATPAMLEERVKAWMQQQVIDRWSREFRRILGNDSTTPALPVEFRLVIMLQPEPLARLEWRREGEQLFQVLKGTAHKTVVEKLQESSLPVTDASLPVAQLLATHARMLSSGVLPLNDVAHRRLIQPLLVNKLISSQIVASTGEPFVHHSAPLEWRADQIDDGEYVLKLVTQDGVEPEGLTCFPGTPNLYLTRDTIFKGPPAWEGGLAGSAKQVVPKIAIETREGVEFLQRLGAVLPESLNKRVKHCRLTVQIDCIIDPLFSGSANDALFLQVTATNPEFEIEEMFMKLGWMGRSGARGAGGLVQLDRTLQQHFPALLDALGASWDQVAQRWKLRITKQFPERFVEWAKALPNGIELQVAGELSTLLGAPVEATVRLECESDGERIDWFNIRTIVDVNDTELSADEVRALLDAKGEFVRLPGKGWRRLQFKLTEEEEKQLAALGLDTTDLTSEPQRLHALQLAGSGVNDILPPDRLAEIRDRARALKLRVAPEMPAAVKADLRPYQVEGFHFLAYLSANGFGGILADDMGLGKTVQTLTWIAWLREKPENENRQVLVVCPKSVMDNWRAEATRFVPGLRVKVGGVSDMEKLRASLVETDLLVINYAQLRQIAGNTGMPVWLAAILDEGQYIKNPESQTAQAARSIEAMHRLVLTGTPVENRLLDLWSLMAFSMPGLLPVKAQFVKHFDARTDGLARNRLAARVRPFLLRRTKQQVAPELPERLEEDLLFEMEEEQRNLYAAELKRAQQLLLRVTTLKALDSERMNFLASLLRLRQICCHPALIAGVKEGTPSAKLEAFVDLLEPLIEEGHKVLVFSQFVSMLRLIEKEVIARDWPYLVLTGDTENRGELVEDFQSREGSAIFLISLKAGGFGLNLTAASYVVLFDPWWNPAVENQAIDRTHRIGQTSKVLAYRLLIKDSVEEKIRRLQERKSALAQDILGDDAAAAQLTLEDFRFLFSDTD